MQLSRPTAFALQTSMVVLAVAGATVPTPLYAAYQHAWGLSPAAITVAFGVYALAVLAALLVTGALSDHLGRRPVLVGATLAQAVAMAIFMAADGFGWLIAARIAQGLALGVAAGAVGAGLLDLDAKRGPSANAFAPMIGTGLGAFGGGLVAQFLPLPTLLPYAGLAGLFLIQAALATRMPETASPRPGAWASLRPRLRVPPALRAPMLAAVPALIAVWSLAGFYGSLGPALVRGLTHVDATWVGGLALATMAFGGVVAVAAVGARPAGQVLAGGMTALIAGVATSLAGITAGAPAVFFLGALVAGMGFGTGFQGAIRTVAPLAAPHERAGVLSVLYVVAYLSMGLPAIGAGVRVVARGGGVAETAVEFGLAVIALAGLALAGMAANRQRFPARLADASRP